MFFYLRFLAVLTIFALSVSCLINQPKEPSPETSASKNVFSSDTNNTSKSGKPEISTTINEILAEYPELNTSIAINNLNDDSVTVLGSTEAYTAASTTKLITAVCFLHQVELGNHSLDESLGSNTARWQLQQMINQSNNTSWNILNRAIGYQVLIKYANDNDFNSFDFYKNTIKTSDEALLLHKLYNRQLLNDSHTDLLLSFMQNTNNEDLIPPGVPKTLTVYHKYGILDNNLHDAAIITDKEKSLALVIFSKNTSPINYSQHITLFQKVVEAVLNYEGMI